MIVLIIVSACVVVGVGIGVFVSKKRFDNNLADADNKSTSSLGEDDSLTHEIDRYEQLKLNLVKVKKK